MTISPAQSDFLNLSRWVAAWLVVAEHARNLIFVDFVQSPQPDAFAKAFYFMTGFGHEAVMVFFVISGYLVGGRVWELFAAGKFGWKRFLADRTSRLYAVLLVALLLGAALDWTGATFFNRCGLYDLSISEPIAVLSRPPIDSLTLRDFLLNALFLQTIVGSTFGSNGPLWSLANEWWYYILFPTVLLTFSPGGYVRKLCGLVAVCGLWLLLPASILWLFGVWLLGVLASRWHRYLPSGWLAAGVFLVALCVARLEILHGPYLWQYLLGLSFAVLLASLAQARIRFPLATISEYLAGFSYSVYLIHFPVLMLTVSAVFFYTGWGIKIPFSAAGVAFYSGVLGMALFMSWLISLFTEARTATLRTHLYRWLHIASQK